MSTPSNKAITAAEKRYPDDGKMNTPDGPQTFPSPRVLCQRGAYATCYDELSERATQLEGERDALVKALKFYAGRLRLDGNGYEFDEEPEIYRGALARKALSQHQPTGR